MPTIIRQLISGAVLIFSQDLGASGTQVLARTIREFPHMLPGIRIEVRKEMDPVEKIVRIASNSEQVQSMADLVALEEGERRLKRSESGALADPLVDWLSKAKDADEKEVSIFMKYGDGVRYLDKTRHPESALREQSSFLAALQPEVDLETFLKNYDLGLMRKMGKAAGVAKVSKAKLRKIMLRSEVAIIEEYLPPSPTQSGGPALSGLANSAYNHSSASIPTQSGQNVNAATFEQGLLQAFVNCIGIPSSLQYRLGITTVPSSHSMITFRLLQYASPGANLWHYPSFSYSDAENWIITNNITAMDASIEGASSPSDGIARFTDDFAYRFPFPVFVGPAGNQGYQYVPGNQEYNLINVGNVRHTNQSAFELVDVANPNGGCTRAKNPAPIYGGSCLTGSLGQGCAGDRELPLLVAPGFSSVPGQPLTDACSSYFSSELGACGTSFSAPVTLGMAANVLAADSRMQGWPEKVRAVLLATAENVYGGEWNSNQDGRDGAGVVNGASAVFLAKNHTSVSSENTPVVDGVGAGALYPADFSGYMNYKIKIPASKPAGKHLRVVLTWDSNPDVDAPFANNLSDLDLSLQHNTGWSSSSSWNGNVEIIDVLAANLTAGATYTAQVNKYIARIPSTARAGFLYYAIAWTWVDDHAP